MLTSKCRVILVQNESEHSGDDTDDKLSYHYTIPIYHHPQLTKWG